MTREEFGQLRAKFEALLAEPLEQRTALLRDLEQSNPVLAEGLRRMLAAYVLRTGWIDRPAAEAMLRRPIARGTQLGAYRIEKELGRGAWAWFLKARAPTAVSRNARPSRFCGRRSLSAPLRA